MESRFISELWWNSHTQVEWQKWQRRMGVEPTRDRAERPPSRFEDGETHRGPYTSKQTFTGRIVPFTSTVVKQMLHYFPNRP